ncbi:ABC transporter substrate-binding protein [Salipiger sp. PrR002]|uniref:ABC transporter substrate-binding protein n=1 Tax=Salipiger sp. PrR002 TaxID=2706489 RepID=UPI0013B86086|nr:ABC transporter substrate-binding protein [Salipiger sp. PrR002]NDW01999.1 ABC transporter substrate-binding protein [Salipiger sp. PrR002]NDW59039.1 ABC transporter substrate-binding protein [Salipiger sp. PrR004]
MKQGNKPTFSRRGFMKASTGLGLALAAPAVLKGNKVFAGETLMVRDMGGTFYEGFKAGFYDSFTEEFGVTIQTSTNEPDPIPQYKMAVDTDTKLFDVALMTPEHVLRLRQFGDDYMLPMQIEVSNPDDFTPNTFQHDFTGVAIYALAMAYRTDTFGEKGPKSWADFWDVDTFKGRRGLWRSPVTTLEMALLADGVALEDLYPLDVDRAFASLDKIKDHVDLWWTSGAQNTQVMQNGEVDMTSAWSTRAQTAISSGAPVELVWNGGLYNIDGWTIAGNTEKADLSRKFVEWCLDAERQAAYTEVLACGPTNMKAYDYISAEKAAVLPTTPEHISGLALLGADYWAENQDALTQRFEQWILG